MVGCYSCYLTVNTELYICCESVCVCCTFYRGYYPKGGGEVIVRMSPIKQLNPINITDRGSVTKIYGRAFVAGVLPFKVSCLDGLRSVCMSC